MKILLWIVTLWSVWSRVLSMPSSNLNLPAFCQPADRKGSNPYHPTKYPGPHVPWVWEAVYDQVTRNVDVALMMPSSCYFNQTKWQEINAQFPQYTKHFSNGNWSNMLVESPELQDTYVPRLLGRHFHCRIYSKNKLIGRVQSMKFQTGHPMMGPLMIRCPIGGFKKDFDSIQIEVPPGMGETTTNRTEIFPVCILPKYKPEQRAYNLSIVTATKRDNPEKLIEWLEYHLILGVEHFFIYNTATGDSESQRRISRTLAQYVERGIVSEVLYPYKNCFTEGMAKGRKAKYLSVTGVDDHFQPPYPIVAYIAHTSAYARFRHTSRYILSQDDDEFVSLTNQLPLKDHRITQVADRMFARYPMSPSIAFLPIWMNSCPVKDQEVEKAGHSQPTASRKKSDDPTAAFANGDNYGGSVSNRRRGGEKGGVDVTLPRVYTKYWGRVGRPLEYKQLYRTDRVALFSVHYLTLLESSFDSKVRSDSEPYVIKVQFGALLHYQTPSFESGDPFSHAEYLPIIDLPQAKRCHSSIDMRLSVYPEDVLIAGETDFYGEKVRNHLMPPALYERLKVNYVESLKQTDTVR